VQDQYSPAEEWREQASYFKAPGANLAELHRETGSTARALLVRPATSARCSFLAVVWRQVDKNDPLKYPPDFVG
jgi:hypothetical protein